MGLGAIFVAVALVANGPPALHGKAVRVQADAATSIPSIGSGRATEPVTFAAPIEACAPEKVLMNSTVSGANGEAGTLTVCLRPEAGALEQRFQSYVGRFREAGFMADGFVRESKDALVSATGSNVRIELFISRVRPEDPMIEIIHQSFTPGRSQ